MRVRAGTYMRTCECVCLVSFPFTSLVSTLTSRSLHLRTKQFPGELSSVMYIELAYLYNAGLTFLHEFRGQELYESRGGRPGLPKSLTVFLVSICGRKPAELNSNPSRRVRLLARAEIPVLV